MKKKFLLIISLIVALTSVLGIVVYATNDTPNNESPALITITYDSDGGSKVDSQQVIYGSKLTAPQAPTKQGYDFAGWYVRLNEESERAEAEKIAKEEDEKVDESALIAVDDNDELWSFVGYVATENITLTAKWVPNDEMPPMEVKFDGKAFTQSLGLMGKGMIGIFVVTLVIIGVVALLNIHGRSLERRNSNKQ